MINLIRIPESWGVYRESPSPLKDREVIYSPGLTYDEAFDWNILFVEAIRINPEQVVLVGPPLFNLKPLINFKGATHEHIDYRKTCTTIVETTADSLVIEHEAEDIVIPVTEPSEALDGKKTMLTMMKNEPIIWIKDWIAYHHLEHGITGFAIFDNDSDVYTTEYVREELSKLPYDITVEVIHWEMQYGPRTIKWDSDFGKITMFEYFKIKYGWCCECVINHDVDEFLLLEDSTLDQLVDYIRANNYSGIGYGNRNMEPWIDRLQMSARDVDVSDRRFYDYYHYTTFSNTHNTDDGFNARKANKWLTIPQLTMDKHWGNHNVHCGRMARAPEGKVIYYAHQYGLQSAFKDDHPFAIKRNQVQVPIEDFILDNLAKDRLAKYNSILDW